MTRIRFGLLKLGLSRWIVCVFFLVVAEMSYASLEDSVANIDGVEVSLNVDSSSGYVVFLTVSGGAIPQPYNDLSTQDPIEAVYQFFAQYGSEFGLIGDPASILRPEASSVSESPAQGRNTIMNTKISDGARWVMRYTQLKSGVPVFGSGVAVRLNEVAEVTGANSKISNAEESPAAPTLTEFVAKILALHYTSEFYKLTDPNNWDITASELYFYNPSLIGPGENKDFLAWKIELFNESSNTRRWNFIDATTGDLLLELDNITTPEEPVGVAVALSPLGEIDSGSEGFGAYPQIVWRAVQGADEYKVWISPAGPEPALESQALDAAVVCSNPVTGTCKWLPAGLMVDGRKYFWWIGTRNQRSPLNKWEWNEQSEWTYITNYGVTPEQIPMDGLHQPAGDYQNSDPTYFEWQRSSLATWYLIRVFEQGSHELAGAKWINSVDANCAPQTEVDGSCSITNTFTEWSGFSSSGDYYWTVQPWNSMGSPHPAQSQRQHWFRTDY